MKETPRYTLPEQTGLLLQSGRYKDTFTLLRRRLTETPYPGMLASLSQLESTYRYMLQYMLQNAQDPGRGDILADIRRRLLGMADSLYREEMAVDSSELYYSTLRMCRLRPANVKALLDSIRECDAMISLGESAGDVSDDLLRKMEEAQLCLFNAFWTGADIGAKDYETLSENLRDGSLSFSTASLCIAAIALGLMKQYSAEALGVLIEAVGNENLRLRARALVSLMLVLSRWSGRISDDSDLMRRLSLMAESEEMKRHIREVAFAIIKTRDTDRVSRKMQQEVMPGLMQLGPEIMKKMKENADDISYADLEGNPEWEELLRSSGLDEKLRELTDMQTDGADVMMLAFSNLKGFPFFRQLPNWFIPFSVRHSHLSAFRGMGTAQVSEMLDMSGLMCDSDKYSFAFSFAHMPQSQQNMVLSQMEGHLEQMREAMSELALHNAMAEFSSEVTRYLRNLYRFHKLYPKKGEFTDPFEKPFNFLALPFSADVFSEDDTVRVVGEFYFKRGYYEEALPLLQSVADLQPDEPHIWEKIGFCEEKMPDGTAKAIEAYMKGQLFNPDSRWITRRLAYCYRSLGKYRSAIERIRALMSEEEYDERLSLLLADTFMDVEKWEEALRELARVDYETPGRPDILRRMAVCNMHLKEFDKAIRLMERIPELELTEDDYRMSGHLAILSGDNGKAVEFYRRTVRPNDAKRLWKTQILKDSDLLVSLGATKESISLMLEAIAYQLEQ